MASRTWIDPNKPRIAAGVLRSLSEDIYTPMGWRRGPDTPDGFWMVSTSGWIDTNTRDKITVAVRVVIAPDGKDYRLRSGESAYHDLEFAVKKPQLDEQDAYLMAVEVIADMEADPLTVLRHAVRLGRTGGPLDGDDDAPAPSRPRKRQASSIR